ncbi:hypothetical protein PILCRDRAFT_349820 [Piloderma croceum F 1598]|uniref:Uncharacterized protein n=1 Tax=Piloderma croceum (strain F 1598) TaxID=765440 RepID=A0A0C3C688_PILCF|nr:hypothetical protein PILCRDRAFT_349820 [Piloderma croceum F 1598]
MLYQTHSLAFSCMTTPRRKGSSCLFESKKVRIKGKISTHVRLRLKYIICLLKLNTPYTSFGPCQ